VLNPFIELARDPVAALSGLGYLLFLTAVLVVGIPHALRTLIAVYNDWQANKNRDKWARLYGSGPGWIPPFAVALQAMWALFVLAVSAWAVGAAVWMLTG
jgi:hypothetical protein